METMGLTKKFRSDKIIAVKLSKIFSGIILLTLNIFLEAGLSDVSNSLQVLHIKLSFITYKTIQILIFIVWYMLHR